MRTLVTYANVMSTLALFVALGGGAYAATTFTGANGVVKLCVSGRGAVQVLKATKTRCGKGSMLVPVNQQGRTGSPGTAGAPGPTGAQGPAGAQGPSGAQGPAGTAAPAYTAGAGLTLTGTAFSADLTQLQSRITGSGCAADQALQSVSQAGTPTCTGLHAYSSTSGVATDYSNETSTVIPAGHWLLIGQALAEASPNGDTGVVCQLQLNSKSVDTVEDTLPANGEYTESPIATVTTTAASNVAQIICNAASPMTAIGANLTIAAIPLTALN